jgi:hypothetical protein
MAWPYPTACISLPAILGQFNAEAEVGKTLKVDAVPAAPDGASSGGRFPSPVRWDRASVLVGWAGPHASIPLG